MTITSTDPLSSQYIRACAGAASLLNQLASANARNDFHKAEGLLYQLNDLVEIGLRVVQQHTEVLDAPLGTQLLSRKGPWNPQDGTRVLPPVEMMQDGDYYQCNASYRQFDANDALVAIGGVWCRFRVEQ